jgi:hypothetical protein
MPILPSGPLSFSQIQSGFGGSNPISLSEYYRSGSFVPNITQTAGIPTSGTISVSTFLGINYFGFDSTITNYTGTYSLYNAMVSAGWNTTSPVQVNLTVTGTVVGDSIFNYAMIIERMPENSIVNLHNYGIISGKPGESSLAFNDWISVNNQLSGSREVGASPQFGYTNAAGTNLTDGYPEGVSRLVTAQHGGRALLIKNPVTNIYNYSGAWIAGGGGAGGNGNGRFGSSHNVAAIENNCLGGRWMPGGSGWDAITCSVVGQLNGRWPYVYNYGNIAGGGGGGGGGLTYQFGPLACSFAQVSAAGGGGGGGQTITSSSGAGIAGCYTFCGGVNFYPAANGGGGASGGPGGGGAGGGVDQGIYNATYRTGGAGGNGGTFGANGGEGNNPSNGPFAFTQGSETFPSKGGFGGRARRVLDGDLILQVGGTVYGNW